MHRTKHYGLAVVFDDSAIVAGACRLCCYFCCLCSISYCFDMSYLALLRCLHSLSVLCFVILEELEGKVGLEGSTSPKHPHLSIYLPTYPCCSVSFIYLLSFCTFLVRGCPDSKGTSKGGFLPFKKTRNIIWISPLYQEAVGKSCDKVADHDAKYVDIMKQRACSLQKKRHVNGSRSNLP